MKKDIFAFMSEYCTRGEIKGNYFPLQFMRIGVPDVRAKMPGEFFDFYILVNVETGERVSECYFEEHGAFVDGVAPVCVDGEWGYIKENGCFLLEPCQGYIEAGNSENGVLIMTREDGKVDLHYALTGDLIAGEAGFDWAESFYEKPDGTAELYVVEREDRCGLLCCSGEWLLKPEEEDVESWNPMNCIEISAVTEDLAYLKFASQQEEIRCLSTNETVVTGRDFSLDFNEEYGIISCWDDNNVMKVYQRRGNELEFLFAEVGDLIHVHTAGIILLLEKEIGKWSMYSTEKKAWLYRGMDEIACCNKANGYPFYLLKRDKLQGFVSVTGEMFVPIEVDDFCFVGKDTLELSTATGVGVYSLKEKKWLFLPQGDVLKPLIYPGAFVVGKLRRGFIGCYYAWRYFANGRFITKYSFKTCSEFKENDGQWYAQVKRTDGKKGWIDLEGRFYEKIKESGDAIVEE